MTPSLRVSSHGQKRPALKDGEPLLTAGCVCLLLLGARLRRRDRRRSLAQGLALLWRAACLEMSGRCQRHHSHSLRTHAARRQHCWKRLAPFRCTAETFFTSRWLCDTRNQIPMPRFLFPGWQSGNTPGRGKAGPRKYLGNRAFILHHLCWRGQVPPAECC